MPARHIKPFSLGLMSKAYTQGDQHRLVVAVFGYFTLGKTRETFLREFETQPEVLPALPKGDILDSLYPKARGEVLVAGQACAPEGKPVKTMSVRLQLAGIDKRLRVIGDREVKRGLTGNRISKPKPFTTMPLDWSRAYGGKAHACNQRGVGYTGKRRLDGMPNVELPGKSVKHGNQSITPAGFGPRATLCPDRQKLFGTFNRRWKKNHAPNLPEDFKPAAFNAAPADQQIKGVFKGGEAYRLEGMHPQKPVVEGEIPDYRVKLVVQRLSQDYSEAEIHAPALDTLWLLPHLDLGVCIYRSVIDCADMDGEDIAALMAAYEAPGRPARSAAHYHDELKKRCERETRHLYVFNDAPLVPVPSPAVLAQRKAAKADAEAQALARKQALLDELEAEFWANTDLEKPADYTPPKAEPSPLGLINSETIGQGLVDMAEVMKKAKAMTDDAHKKADEQLTELEKSRTKGDIAGVTPEPEPIDPEKEKQEAEQRADLKAPSPLAPAIVKARETGELSDAQLAELATAEENMVKGLKQARQMAVKATREPVLPEVAAHLRNLVQTLLMRGEPLAGRDLTGVDLSGLDLRGQDLAGCILEGADLSRTNLSKAGLRGVILVEARLDHTILDGADLSEANLNKTQGHALQCRGARLNKAKLFQAELPEADFSGIQAEHLMAHQADLNDARFVQTHLKDSQFLDCRLNGSRWNGADLATVTLFESDFAAADFSDSRLMKVIFSRTLATGSRWDRARLEKTLLNMSELEGASFKQILALTSNWRESRLKGSQWQGASLLKCDLGDARLEAADLTGAAFSQCILMNASLAGAQAQGADFFQALLRKTDLRAADLRQANLVRALDQGADYHDAKLKDAVRTTLGEAA